MKKLLIVCTTLLLLTNSFGFSVYRPMPAKKASELMLPIGKDMQISLLDLSEIKINDFEKITGNHLKFMDRVAFKAAQNELRKSINTDGTINNKKLMKFMASESNNSGGFHLGGFLLGFLLGLIGVLIAYLLGGEPDVKKNRIKWSWIGLGIEVLIGILVLVLR